MRLFALLNFNRKTKRRVNDGKLSKSLWKLSSLTTFIQNENQAGTGPILLFQIVGSQEPVPNPVPENGLDVPIDEVMVLALCVELDFLQGHFLSLYYI